MTGDTVTLIGATAPCSPPFLIPKTAPSGDALDEGAGGEESGGVARTASLRMSYPRARTRWLSVADEAVRFGRDAYSDAVCPQTDYKACAGPKPA